MMAAFDPFTIFLSAIAGGLLAGAAIVYLAVLTLDMMRNWFRQNKPMNKNAVKFAVKAAVSGGKVRVITGFYDIEEENVLKTQTYEVEQIEEKLKLVLEKENEVILLT
jgi:hypothetical protein